MSEMIGAPGNLLPSDMCYGGGKPDGSPTVAAVLTLAVKHAEEVFGLDLSEVTMRISAQEAWTDEERAFLTASIDEQYGVDSSAVVNEVVEKEWWTPEEETALVEALTERFNTSVMTILASGANADGKTVELTDYPDADGNVIYIQVSEGHAVFAIGAPGFDFGD